MTQKIERLRERVQKVEAKLQALYEENMFDWNILNTSLHKCKQAERLLWQRKRLLDEMFVATPEEIVQFEQINTKLLGLTKQMYASAEEVLRKMATMSFDYDFEDFISVSAKLEFDVMGGCPILSLENDDYYGSDFYSMFYVFDSLYRVGHLSKSIEWCSGYCQPLEYKAEMSSEELGLIDENNDGTSWYKADQPAADKLKHLCVCHAIHELSVDKPYSIPDILRMNYFEIRLNVEMEQPVSLNDTQRKVSMLYPDLSPIK